MRIELANVPPQGHLEEVGERSRWAFDAAGRALGGNVKDIGGELSVVVRGESALVRGELRTFVERDCDRCGAPVHLTIEGRVELEYRPEFLEDEGVRELSSSDMALGFYQNGCLDLSDAVCDHIALLLPLQIFCDQPNVESLGVGCTQEALKSPDAVDVDPRFAALQSLKLD